MQASISNYRGVSTATLLIDAITLVAGHNGNGKSSCCQAVGAALTGEPMPIDDENGNRLAKTKAGVLVRSGTAAGRVELTSAAGTTEVAWPTAKVKTAGQPPAASEFAVGLNSIVTMETKKRIPFLIDYLMAQPTKEDLAAAIGALVPAGTVDKLWELIQATGWDSAYNQVKEKGAKYKGQWEQVTNANYGPKLAGSWLPNGYEPNLEGASEDTLKAMVTDARDALEAAIAASAVDDSKRQDLEVVVAQLPARQKALDSAKKPLLEDQALKAAMIDMQEAKQILLGLQNALDDLRSKAPKADVPPTKIVCPCCNEALMMTATYGVLTKYAVTGPTQEDIDAHAVKVSEKVKAVNAQAAVVKPLEAKHKELTDARAIVVRNWDQGIADASRLVREAMTAKEELDAMAAPSTAQAGASVEQCRNDLAAHELRLSAFVAKRNADFLHNAIELNQALLKHVAPTGVRADVLTTAIQEFNKKLQSLSETAGWAPVEITPEFSFQYNGTPYFLLSSAEQFRVRVIVQLAMALREKAAMVVVDGADILDKPGRNGLFRLLKAAGIPALVGMTIDAEENVPNLAKAGYGRSYWLGGAVARELA